jgi:hypothetical protein
MHLAPSRVHESVLVLSAEITVVVAGHLPTLRTSRVDFDMRGRVIRRRLMRNQFGYYVRPLPFARRNSDYSVSSSSRGEAHVSHHRLRQVRHGYSGHFLRILRAAEHCPFSKKE